MRSNTVCSEYSQSITSEVSRLSQLDEMRDVTETDRVFNDHRYKSDSDTRKTPLAKQDKPIANYVQFIEHQDSAIKQNTSATTQHNPQHN